MKITVANRYGGATVVTISDTENDNGVLEVGQGNQVTIDSNGDFVEVGETRPIEAINAEGEPAVEGDPVGHVSGSDEDADEEPAPDPDAEHTTPGDESDEDEGTDGSSTDDETGSDDQE